MGRDRDVAAADHEPDDAADAEQDDGKPQGGAFRTLSIRGCPGSGEKNRQQHQRQGQGSQAAAVLHLQCEAQQVKWCADLEGKIDLERDQCRQGTQGEQQQGDPGAEPG